MAILNETMYKRIVYTNEEIWTIFSLVLIDLTGARIRENFNWRILKLFCLSFEYSRVGGSIMKLSILFSIRDNAVLARLEKYSVRKAAFLSSGLASRRLQATGGRRYRWKWAVR